MRKFYFPAGFGLFLGLAMLAGPSPLMAAEVDTSGHHCNDRNPGKKYDREYFIYFDTNSSTVKPEYRDTINRVYDTAKGQSAQQICLFAKASKQGPEGANAKLSMKRAKSVARELERLGWPAGHIAIDAEGEAWGWLQNTLTSDAKEDRRVRIRLSD